LYLRNIKEIPEDTPIWDFILGEIENYQLIRIIIGEVKTQKARTSMSFSLTGHPHSATSFCILSFFFSHLSALSKTGSKMLLICDISFQITH